jgi:uncharacterized membrane protein
MAFNVPLTDQLANAADTSTLADSAGVRASFEGPWVAWNIVRTVTSTAAAGCLAYALLLHGAASLSRTRRSG